MKAVAKKIIKRLRGAGFKAYFVGGAVRDALMGRRPKDYDICTSARPEEISSLFARSLMVGAAFGVVMVRMEGKVYQTATFRRDLGGSDGRHPDRVLFTEDERHDVERRDFTINGLLMDPFSGKIIDYVGGKRDIARRIVRTIGDPEQRFAEDRLRLLRALRFATTLGFELHETTAEAIRNAADRLSGLSAERITEELRLIVVHPDRGAGLRKMHQLGLLRAILPEVALCEGITQDERFHPEGDVLEHTFRVLEALRKPDFVLALGALLHDVAKPPTRSATDRIRFYGHDTRGAAMAETICRRLRLSGKETKAIVELVGRHMHFVNLQKMRESKLRRFLESPLAPSHVELHRADCLASHGKLDNIKYIAAMRRKWGRQPQVKEPLLMGRDLLEMGYAPGPLLGQILAEVSELQYEGKLETPRQARDHVERRYPRT